MISLLKVSGVLAVEYLIDGWCGISAYTPTICRLRLNTINRGAGEPVQFGNHQSILRGQLVQK